MVVAVLLFAVGIGTAWLWYALSEALSFFGPLLWWGWTPIVLGSAAAIAALGLFSRRRASAISAALIMVALACWFFPSQSIRANDYGLSALCLLTSALVCWRFALQQNAKTPPI